MSQENQQNGFESLNKPSNNKWFFLSALLMGIILGYCVSFVLPISASQNAKTDVIQAEKNKTGDTEDKKIDMKALMSDDAVEGNADAKVTIVEFSDFECPFCGKYYTDTYLKIKKDYIDTGKVKYVFRNFPLGFHKNAMPAALASECAGDQGKFYEMHDKLFKNQSAFSTQADINKFFVDLAGQIGLDKGKFETCLTSKKFADEITKDMKDAEDAGVTGTPAFFINGTKLVGAQPYSKFQSAIDEALKK